METTETKSKFDGMRVDTSISSGVRSLGVFILILAILCFVASFILGVVCMFSWHGEEYVLPLIITIGSGVSLLITRGLFRAIAKITEAAEYVKAHLSRQYDSVYED